MARICSRLAILIYILVFLVFINLYRKYILMDKATGMDLLKEKEETLLSRLTNKVDSVRSDDVIPKKAVMPESSQLLRTVHFVWCGSKDEPFSFKNYLSVRSVAVYLQPDVMYFHCNKKPNWFHIYHSWFNETLENNPWFFVKEDQFDCLSDNNVIRYIFSIMDRYTGIYIGQDTIVTGADKDIWNINDYRNTLNGYRNGYMIVPLSQIHSAKRLAKVDQSCSYCKNPLEMCTVYNGNNNTLFTIARNKSLTCMYIKEDIYPKNIWLKKDTVGKILNYLFYGQVTTPEPVPSLSDSLVPNICHIVWIGGRSMNYLFYLNALSALYILKVDMLFIHGDYEPYGPNWDKLKHQPRVRFIRIEVVSQIYGNKVHLNYHISDSLRFKILNKYGGIYTDVDAMFTQPIPDWLRRYDAVSSLDWAHQRHPYPDYINFGVTLGKQGAPFWKLITESMKNFHDKIFGYNGLLMPYKVYEHHPEALFIHKPLQVMCFRDQCYPLSGENFTTMNWKRNTHAFHWTYPDPVEFSNKSALLASDTMFAQMGQYVLKAAGEI